MTRKVRHVIACSLDARERANGWSARKNVFRKLGSEPGLYTRAQPDTVSRDHHHHLAKRASMTTPILPIRECVILEVEAPSFESNGFLDHQNLFGRSLFNPQDF